MRRNTAATDNLEWWNRLEAQQKY